MLKLHTDKKIYTITLNPSLDLLLAADKIQLGSVNRLESRALVVGGKGINVSLILKELGIDSCAMSFVGGTTGESVESELKKQSIETDFVNLSQGFTRINVKVNAAEETELNSSGPVIDSTEAELFLKKIESLPAESFVILAGSMPPSLPEDYYESILTILNRKNIPFAADVSGNKLTGLLKYKPYVIKPNNFELAEMLSVKINTRKDIISGAESCIEAGAQNVIVSLGSHGSMLTTGNSDSSFYPAYQGEEKVVNTTACGDSMLAGFLAASLSGMNEKDSMLLATACGAATAFSSGIGKADMIERIFDKLYKNS